MITSRTLRRCASVKAIPMLPASTVTRSSIRKQVNRCAEVARPLASNELGKS